MNDDVWTERFKAGPWRQIPVTESAAAGPIRNCHVAKPSTSPSRQDLARWESAAGPVVTYALGEDGSRQVVDVDLPKYRMKSLVERGGFVVDPEHAPHPVEVYAFAHWLTHHWPDTDGPAECDHVNDQDGIPN